MWRDERPIEIDAGWSHGFGSDGTRWLNYNPIRSADLRPKQLAADECIERVESSADLGRCSDNCVKHKAHIQHDVPSERTRITGEVYSRRVVESSSMEDPINSYLHTYYEDIEDPYRENIYRAGI